MSQENATGSGRLVELNARVRKGGLIGGGSDVSAKVRSFPTRFALEKTGLSINWLGWPRGQRTIVGRGTIATKINRHRRITKNRIALYVGASSIPLDYNSMMIPSNDVSGGAGTSSDAGVGGTCRHANSDILSVTKCGGGRGSDANNDCLRGRYQKPCR